MSARLPLCDLLRRLVEGPLDHDAVASVRAELADRLPDLAGEEAVAAAALAWFLDDFSAYEDAFEEDRAKKHGASWLDERRRVWGRLAQPLAHLEVACCEGGGSDDLLRAMGDLLGAWAAFTRRGRARA